MKKFNPPSFEMVEFSNEDVITTSVKELLSPPTDKPEMPIIMFW